MKYGDQLEGYWSYLPSQMESLTQAKQDFIVGLRDLIELNPELCTLEALIKYMLHCRDLTIGLRSRQNKRLLGKLCGLTTVKKQQHPLILDRGT